jgi:predicted HicB family RNase H-like nuclease
MKDLMEYKGYFGTVHYSDEDQVFYGKLAFIRSLISYEGTDVKSLHDAFAEAVDDYLQLCEKTGRPPEKPFKGTLRLRMNSDLHRRAAVLAEQRGVNLNSFLVEAIENHLDSLQNQ